MDDRAKSCGNVKWEVGKEEDVVKAWGELSESLLQTGLTRLPRSY